MGRMFDALGKILGAAKDKALETSAKAFLNHRIAAFGNVTAITLNTGLRKASLTAELKGESVPISIEIGNYDIVEQDGRTCIRVQAVTTNREWLNLAMEQYLVGRLLPLPGNILQFLK